MPDLYTEIAERVIADLQNAPFDSPDDVQIVVREAIATILRPHIATVIGTLAEHDRDCRRCGERVWLCRTPKGELVEVSREMDWHHNLCKGKAKATGEAA